MRRLMRHILVAFLGIGCVCRVYGAPVQEGLFPTSTGFSGKIIGESVNIRNYPDMDARVKGKIHFGQVKIIGKNDEWYKVVVGDDEGWIYSKYVETKYPERIPYAKVKGEEVVAYGMQFIGTPYVWGGNSLQKGVDCSGFTKEVYEAFDINLSRVSYMQAKDGPAIPKHKLRTGDLVFFDTEGVNDGNVSHVGIYVGGNRFLHSDSTHGVMISKLDSNYYTRNYVKGVRVLGS